LNDQYTSMLTRQERISEKAEEEGTFSGVGIVYAVKEVGGQVVFDSQGKTTPATDASGHPIIGRVIQGTPAEKAGLKAGDIITYVDGHELIASSLDAVVKQVRGPAGKRVTFTVKRQGLTLTIVAVRAQVSVPDVTYRLLPGNIGYIRLDDFDRKD